MPVTEISHSQFNELSLPDSCRVLWEQSHEAEWYANSAGTVLGVILFNPETNYWGYVMCARVAGGEFQRLGVGADFTSVIMARRDLTAGMERNAEHDPPA